jgi:hypothetical protein
VGTSQFILRKLIQEGPMACQPSKYAQFGKTRIYLYTRDDIEAIRKHVEAKYQVHDHDGPARKPGRPAKFTRDQRKKRARLYSKAWYWKNRAKILSEQGDEAGAQKAKERAKEVEALLHG